MQSGKNAAVLTEDRAFALSFVPPRGIWQLKNPHPREWAMSGAGHEIQSFFTSYLVLHFSEVW